MITWRQWALNGHYVKSGQGRSPSECIACSYIDNSHWSVVIIEMKMAENTGLFGVFGIALILWVLQWKNYSDWSTGSEVMRLWIFVNFVRFQSQNICRFQTKWPWRRTDDTCALFGVEWRSNDDNDHWYCAGIEMDCGQCSGQYGRWVNFSQLNDNSNDIHILTRVDHDRFPSKCMIIIQNEWKVDTTGHQWLYEMARGFPWLYSAAVEANVRLLAVILRGFPECWIRWSCGENVCALLTIPTVFRSWNSVHWIQSYGWKSERHWFAI